MPPPHPVAVRLDPEVHVRLRALAQAQQRSAHFLMREAIAQYLDREEAREALRQDALRAWSAYQETGLHEGQAGILALRHQREEGHGWALSRSEAERDLHRPRPPLLRPRPAAAARVRAAGFCVAEVRPRAHRPAPSGPAAAPDCSGQARPLGKLCATGSALDILGDRT